jgi:uncharacterized protein
MDLSTVRPNPVDPNSVPPNSVPPNSVPPDSVRRKPGPDVVRAVALIGVVVMNYHGYLIIRGAVPGNGWADDLFNPWSGPLSTRFAATFVLVAGVGVTLLTQRSLGDPERITEMRWRLMRRGAILYLGGLYLDTIWAGTIIPYYGAMFVIAAALFTVRSRWVIAVGVVAVAGGALLSMWRFWQNQADESTAWLFVPPQNSLQSFPLGVFVNGTHPLLPWLGYFCAGIVLGRVLGRPCWRAGVGGIGLMLFAVAELASGLAGTPFQELVLSTNASSRGIIYVASALGTALLAYVVVDMIAERFATAVDPLRRAGQMSLTLYLLHIVVFNFAVDWMGWVVPSDLSTALLFAGGFWIAAIALANLWHRHFGRGPAERIYRAIGG